MNITQKEREQAEAVAILKEWGLDDGTTVYARVNHVSASGMSRNVGLYIAQGEYVGVLEGGQAPQADIIQISYHAAKALGWPYKDGYNGGIRVSGCGMDMLFHTIDSLSYAMGYGSICQDRDRILPIEKHKLPNGERLLAIGLKYRSL